MDVFLEVNTKCDRHRLRHIFLCVAARGVRHFGPLPLTRNATRDTPTQPPFLQKGYNPIFAPEWENQAENLRGFQHGKFIASFYYGQTLSINMPHIRASSDIESPLLPSITLVDIGSAPFQIPLDIQNWPTLPEKIPIDNFCLPWVRATKNVRARKI